jgi:hypothetical protein
VFPFASLLRGIVFPLACVWAVVFFCCAGCRLTALFCAFAWVCAMSGCALLRISGPDDWQGDEMAHLVPNAGFASRRESGFATQVSRDARVRTPARRRTLAAILFYFLANFSLPLCRSTRDGLFYFVLFGSLRISRGLAIGDLCSDLRARLHFN